MPRTQIISEDNSIKINKNYINRDGIKVKFKLFNLFPYRLPQYLLQGIDPWFQFYHLMHSQFRN